MRLCLLPVVAACTASGVPAVEDTGARDPDVVVDTAPDSDGEVDTGEPVASPLCDDLDGHVVCVHQMLALRASPSDLRRVEFQIPSGVAPAAGWPAVVLFSGSLVSAERFWDARDGEPFGLYHQARVVAALLAAGVAVITPETRGDGLTWWDTNVPPYATSWEAAPDHALMLALLDAIDEGRFGPVDPGALSSGGLSSGGYMASRVALAYPGRFRRIVVQSASYMTCAGAACVVPDLPADHPPALLLAGSADTIVPAWTTRLYADKLREAGVEVESRITSGAGHEWTPDAPGAVRAFLAR